MFCVFVSCVLQISNHQQSATIQISNMRAMPHNMLCLRECQTLSPIHSQTRQPMATIDDYHDDCRVSIDVKFGDKDESNYIVGFSNNRTITGNTRSIFSSELTIDATPNSILFSLSHPANCMIYNCIWYTARSVEVDHSPTVDHKKTL